MRHHHHLLCVFRFDGSVSFERSLIIRTHPLFLSFSTLSSLSPSLSMRHSHTETSGDCGKYGMVDKICPLDAKLISHHPTFLPPFLLSSCFAIFLFHPPQQLFLTMLTGTAGNAGNQSSAMVIRGLATGEINRKNGWRVVMRELKVRRGEEDYA